MIKVNFRAVRGFSEAIKNIQGKQLTVRQHIKNLGEKTAEKMKAVIKENKVRPQAGEPTTLEDTITVEHFETANGFGWGVGNIDKLNQEAIYWKAVNYGSSHMVGKWLPPGAFRPGTAKPSSSEVKSPHGGTGRWFKGEGNWSKPVTRSIPAMNYIEKTVNWFRGKVRELVTAFRS
jgi:hypothetical protein